MRIIVTLALSLILGATASSIYFIQGKRADIVVTLIGSFWGFLLSQGGLMIYERHKQKEELISMLASAKHELQMNRDVISWISHLLAERIAEQDLHGLGFSGVDQISEKAIEHIVTSPLTYKLASREFVSRHLLSIYQTILVYKREIPTDRVDGRSTERYGRIKFAKVIRSFDLLISWVNAEGIRLCGRKRWEELTEREEISSQAETETCFRCGAHIDATTAACGTCGLATPKVRVGIESQAIKLESANRAHKRRQKRNATKRVFL